MLQSTPTHTIQYDTIQYIYEAFSLHISTVTPATSEETVTGGDCSSWLLRSVVECWVLSAGCWEPVYWSAIRMFVVWRVEYLLVLVLLDWFKERTTCIRDRVDEKLCGCLARCSRFKCERLRPNLQWPGNVQRGTSAGADRTGPKHEAIHCSRNEARGKITSLQSTLVQDFILTRPWCIIITSRIARDPAARQCKPKRFILGLSSICMHSRR